MTLPIVGSCFKVKDDNGIIIGPSSMRSLDVEWNRNTIAELANMAPVQEMRSGSLYVSFLADSLNWNLHTHEDLTGANVSVVIEFSQNNWVQYKDARLVSSPFAHGEDGLRIDTIWAFRDFASFHTPPIELRSPRQIPPIQKLDWKRLGF